MCDISDKELEEKIAKKKYQQLLSNICEEE